jgi:ribosomal protein L12E/L44/L45/RPP1/RPP2
MLVAGGNTAPTAADVTKVLGEVGVEADAASLSKLIADMAGKDIDELIAAGQDQLVTLGGGGGGGGGGAAATDGEAAAAVEEAKPIEEEVDPMEGGMDMFGGGGGDY